MDATQFVDTLFIDTNVTFLAIVVVSIMSLIQISPIKINPWSWIARAIGRAINGDIFNEIKGIKEEINDIKESRKEYKKEREFMKATACRRRILNFDDELRRRLQHSEESFNSIIEDIDFYVPFCEEHKNDYSNKKAEAAISNILEKYKQCKEQNDFI